ncbi:TPA: hypothetical protein ENX78_01410 [Candidatus Poribacteria bacterium]|nr:hypothetical protein [Candidatus Poribacteria bacterium]
MSRVKILEGTYIDGNIIVKDTDNIRNGEKVIIIVDMTKEEIIRELSSYISDEFEYDIFNKANSKPFSIKKSKFFSNNPEHLGKTSALDIDRILSDEAMGHRKWKKSS